MKNKVVRITVTVLCALAVAAAAFAAGYLTHKWTAHGALSSYEWFIDTVDKHYYYGGFEDGYSETGLKEIADKYLDRYSEYYTKEEYAKTLESNNGNKTGIGVSYAFVDGKGIYLSTVIGNSPAYMQGLRAGEVLTGGSLGEEEVTFNSSEDFSKLVNSAGDGQDINLTSASGKSYVVSKSQYTASYAYMSTRDTAWIFGDSADGGLALYEKPEEKITSLPQGCAYLKLTQFYGSAADEFRVLIGKFNASHCTSLILDLRSNGGGYVKLMQRIAGCFADGEQKLAMLARDKNGKASRYYCERVSEAEYRVSKDTDVYVLANSGTASASEALIGAMVCYGALGYGDIFLSDYSDGYLSWLKGAGREVKTARTFGKGIMQSPFENKSTGEVLKLTTAEIYWPDEKTCIHERGLNLSDGCVSVTAEWEHTLPDGELNRVIDNIAAR